MRKVVAAVVATLCPLAMAGLVGGYEAELLPFWGMIVLGAGTIYAEWWGLSTLDSTKE